MTTQERDTLREQLDKDFPKAWKALDEGEGAEIIGTFLRVEHGSTTFGPAPIVIIATDDGEERSIWLLWDALKNGFRRTQPAVGERIGVRYLGKQKVKTQTAGRASEYHNFRVVVDRPDGVAPDWGAALGPDERSPEPDEDDLAGE